MADDLRMALQDLLRKSELGDPAFLREGVRVLAQELMELEVSQHLGAERYERGPERRGERNGHRERAWGTRVGTVAGASPRRRHYAGGDLGLALHDRHTRRTARRHQSSAGCGGRRIGRGVDHSPENYIRHRVPPAEASTCRSRRRTRACTRRTPRTTWS